jgi:hypothetical protein
MKIHQRKEEGGFFEYEYMWSPFLEGSKNSREKFTPQNPNPSGTGPGGLKPLFLLRARRTFFYKGVGFYLSSHYFFTCSGNE